MACNTCSGSKGHCADIGKKIKHDELTSDQNGSYNVMIIAEQPYAGRRARQVQRAFNAELKEQGLSSSTQIVIEGVSPGLQQLNFMIWEF